MSTEVSSQETMFSKFDRGILHLMWRLKPCSPIWLRLKNFLMLLMMIGSCLLFASTSYAANYYVSPDGSDSSNGSAGAPWRTIAHGVSRLIAGDTLNIEEGTYVEDVDMISSGTPDQYITIQGIGNVLIDGTDLYDYAPVFETRGYDYIRFRNLKVINARAGVEVSAGSDHIEIDQLVTNGNHFAVKIVNGAYITIKNSQAANSRNAFRAEGSNSHHLHFENIVAYGSKDIYQGMDPNYLNGDGFIFEPGVHDVTMKNIISFNHWDAGFDIKANNVLIENVVTFGNKNNFKTWGGDIVIKSSLSHTAQRQLRPDGTYVDGNGINVRPPTSDTPQSNVTLINVTFVNNEDYDIKVGGSGAIVTLKNSIVYRRNPIGHLLVNSGTFSSEYVMWYWEGREGPTFPISPTDIWADPQFVNHYTSDYRLKPTSPAVELQNVNPNSSALDLDLQERLRGTYIDLGAYEYRGEDGGGGQNECTVPSDCADDGNICTDATCVAGVCGIQTNTNSCNDQDMCTSADHCSDGACTGTAIPNCGECDDPFTFCDGDVASGVVYVQPNQDMWPGIQKVRYYIDGSQSGVYYSAPFQWGGAAGFDTRALSNGPHMLSGAYTTWPDREDVQFQIDFTVQNDSAAVMS